jgi:hypothetical protein
MPKVPALPKDLISIDTAYKKLKETLNELDQKNREIAATVGPVAYIHSMEADPGVGPLPPYLPIRLTLPKNAILPTITYMLEGLRLIVLSGPLESNFLRKMFTIALAVLDVSRGEWKNGVLALMGLFGKTPMLFGLFGRMFRQVWNFVSPDLQNRLEDDVFMAGKSLFAGFWLTMITTFSPESVRQMIDGVSSKLKVPIEQINKKLESLEQASKATADKMGLVVKFPRVPLEDIPSSDDLQSLQVILRKPSVACNPTVRGVLKPMLDTPVLKLLLELFNIPTSDEAVAELCKDQPADFVESVLENLTPTVVAVPSSTDITIPTPQIIERTVNIGFKGPKLSQGLQ